MKFLLLLCFCLWCGWVSAESEMVFVTVADKERYVMVRKCLDSIVKTNREDLGHIAVFDLGFTPGQREALNGLDFVHVYDIEPVNPDMFKLFVVRPNGRKARGWYSWKPVLLKQALDMFPVILYLDASTLVKRSLKDFFAHIREHGYLLVNCWHNGREMTTQPLIKKFGLDDLNNRKLLELRGIDGGFQGLTRAVYDTYVNPVYELARDIKNFEDDGSAPGGFGRARHDQALFNIFARLLNMDVLSRNHFALTISGKKVALHFDKYVELKGLKRPKP